MTYPGPVPVTPDQMFYSAILGSLLRIEGELRAINVSLAPPVVEVAGADLFSSELSLNEAEES